GFLATVPDDLVAARDAIARRDLPALGEVAERSALTMHASALAARPAVVYWRGATVEALAAVAALRRDGIGAWATVDAGPHVKVLCAPDDADEVAGAMRAIPGVSGTIIAGPRTAATVAGEAATLGSGPPAPSVDDTFDSPPPTELEDNTLDSLPPTAKEKP